MSTIFHAKATKSPVISFLFLEHLAKIIAEDREIQIAAAVQTAYKFATKDVLSTEDCLSIIKRLEETKPKEDQPPEEPIKDKKSMGTSIMKWVSSLPPDKLCMFVADYDFDSAQHLYCDVDHQAVIELGELKQQDRWQTIVANFETTMYGFGGSYKGDSQDSSADNVIDMEPDEDGKVSDAALAAIRSMGF